MLATEVAVSGFVGDDIEAAMYDAGDLWNSFIAAGVISISGRDGVSGALLLSVYAPRVRRTLLLVAESVL